MGVSHTKKKIHRAAKLALREADNENYNHSVWFFGAGYLPRWTGYSLGWAITGDLPMDLNSLKPSKLISVPANKFRKSLLRIAGANRKITFSDNWLQVFISKQNNL